MSITEKPIIPSTEGVIDLTTLETSIEIDQESTIQKDLEDALAGRTITDDPLGLRPSKKVETAEEVDIEEEDEDEVPPQPKGDSNNAMLASLKLILGDDITTISQQNDDGEEVEVLLEDLDLTPTLLAEIISAKHQMDLEESKKDSISVKGVSELGKALVEIDKRGGDITELIRVKEALSDPLDSLDMDTIWGQKQALTIRLQASNTPQEDIELLLSAYESKGILEEKANSAANELKNYFKNLVEEKKLQTIAAEEKKKSLLKDYTKDLKTSISDSFELKPAVQDKIVKTATKKTDGGTYEIDDIYTEWRNDPKKTALLTLFLLDNEEYNNQVSSKKRVIDKLENASKLGVIKLGRKSSNKEQDRSNQNKSERIDLSQLT